MREVLNVEIFAPGDMTQYHMMLTRLGNTYVLSVLNFNLCFHFNSGSNLVEAYVSGKLPRQTNPCTVKAMLCWLAQQELPDVNVFFAEPEYRSNYGVNRHDMSEFAESVL